MYNVGLFPGLPLPQLTKLKLTGYVVAEDIVVVLNKRTLLENCILRSIYPARERDADSPSFSLPDAPIRLPHLQHLDMSFAPDIDHLLFSLEAPTISSMVTDITFSSPKCRPFFQRLTNLRRLMIIGSLNPQSKLGEEFLPPNPIEPLVEVRVQAHSFLPSTLTRTGTGDLLPRVEYLELCEGDPDLVVNMLNARALAAQAHPERVSHIKKTSVRCKRTRNVEGRVDDSRSKGMEIDVLTLMDGWCEWARRWGGASCTRSPRSG